MGIKEFFFDNEPVTVNYEMIRLDKIKVLKCKGYPDCSYIETVDLSFKLCDNKGCVSLMNVDYRFHVVLEIDTGYRPDIYIEKDLRKYLKPFNIFELETLIKAFKYREF